jgi:hypothetical protein
VKTGENPRSNFVTKEVSMAFCRQCGSPVEGAFCTKCGAKVDAPGAPGVPPPQSPAAASPIVIPTPPAQAPKKGRFIFWALGGCLVLIVIAVVILFSTGIFIAKKTGIDIGLMQKDPGLAVAKMLATSNPDLEVLSIDEDRGIIRVRNKKTGKDLIMDLKDAKNGKIAFLDDKNQRVELRTRGEGDNATLEIQSSEGSVRIGANAGRLPSWLPSYPGTEAGGGVEFYSEKGDSGSCSFKSKDSAEAISAFYENALKNAGFEVQKSITQIPGQGSMIILSAENDSVQRKVNVTAIRGEGDTTINLAFEGK